MVFLVGAPLLFLLCAALGALSGWLLYRQGRRWWR
jgi:hypothetical protein